MDVKILVDQLKKSGFDFFCGVPCSLLGAFYNCVMTECRYVAAANEGDAVAIASGAFLGGKKPVLLMQNSGLTNAVSPLVSLNYIFNLPVLGFIGMRGEPGLPDEPQHELIGRITPDLLKAMQINHAYLSPDIETALGQLAGAKKMLESNQPFFFLVRKGVFTGKAPAAPAPSGGENIIRIPKSGEDLLPSRIEALEIVNSLKDGRTVQLATTGMTGRELLHLEDAPNNLYMVGSMGCVSSLGLGLALAREDLDIVVLDGDGSLVMRMGSLATNGFYSPRNLLHILLDNGSYDSTGGQFTVSGNMAFMELAAACGYSRSIYTHGPEEFKNAILEWKKDKGLTFVHMKIKKGSLQGVSRPRMTPREVKERLMVFING